jgi:long-chain acyl-CoA synthetase
MRTLPELFLHNTAAFAARSALVAAERTFTYADLRARVLALAAELGRRGVRPGDRVGVMLRNSPEFVIAYWAIVSAGAVAVPLNDEYRHNEILYFIDACGLSLILTSESHRAVCDAVLPQTTTSCALSFSETWQALPAVDAWRSPAVEPAAPVMFQFSSGSTGRPKRIARSHAKLLWELDALADALALTPDDRFLGVAPFSHVNGLMRSMMASFRAGASLYPVAHFDRQVVATLVERERLTIFIGVPFMFIVLAETRFDPAPNWRSLRWCISASAPLPIKYNRAFHDKFGIHVRQLYGSTETGSMSVNLSDDIAETLDSVGAPLPGIAFGIVDDGARRLPAGTVGEVIVSSPGAIEGYDGFPELNAEVFRDGFFHTGDLGRIDARGRLYLQGRLKFLINKSGFKIDPREVESLLEDHPAVDQVAVVGVATPYGDEKVKAVIVRHGPCTEVELAEFCRGKIADFKIPSVFEFRDAMPTSPTGKIRRGLLTS